MHTYDEFRNYLLNFYAVALFHETNQLLCLFLKLSIHIGIKELKHHALKLLLFLSCLCDRSLDISLKIFILIRVTIIQVLAILPAISCTRGPVIFIRFFKEFPHNWQICFVVAVLDIVNLVYAF
jgi:hypothetical protein